MKQLGQAVLTTGSGVTIYTVPTGFKSEINDILIANTGSSPINCSIHLVPVGVAVGTSNAMLKSVPIEGNTTVNWSGRQVLTAGDFIQGIGSGSGLTVTISGEESRQGT